VFGTQVRCHGVTIIISSGDTRLIQDLAHTLDGMTLPPYDAAADGDQVPLCVKDYANTQNLVSRVDPAFPQHRYNPVPVRIIIGKDGKVKHIHVISAFPDQSDAIINALHRWRFKPYLRNGHPVEVETGIQFGTPLQPRDASP
jgi:hypothetical protein